MKPAEPATVSGAMGWLKDAPKTNSRIKTIRRKLHGRRLHSVHDRKQGQTARTSLGWAANSLTLNRATGSLRHCKQHGGLGICSNGLQQQEAAPLEGLAPMRPGHRHSLQAGQLT